jgi:hypothetical protein
MYSFKKFFHLREFGQEIYQEPTDHIILRPVTIGENDCLQYKYQVDNANYTVYFCKSAIAIESNFLTDNVYVIGLGGPSGDYPTGKGTPTKIYTPTFLAIKKLINEKNPDALKFAGFVPEQKLLYRSFYERFLKNYYTDIGYDTYLNNQFLQKIKDSKPALYTKIENRMNKWSNELDNLTKNWEKVKKEKRQRFLNLKTAINKIVVTVFSGRTRPALLKSVNQEQSVVFNGIEDLDVDNMAIEPFSPLFPTNQYEPTNLKEKLNKLFNIDYQFWFDPNGKSTLAQGYSRI